jgi:hypothetical protein
MSKVIASGTAAAASTNTADNDAALIPGREEALKAFAAEVMTAGGMPPETKVPDEPAKTPAEGEKPADALSQSTEKALETPAAGAEPAWSQDKLDWFASMEAAKTPEEIAAAQAKAPEFTAEEVTWLQSQQAEPAPQGEDHLAEDAELKGKLDAATQDRINKRIGKEVAKTKEAKEAAEQAQAKITELEAKLASKPAVSPDVPTAGPLSQVVDEAGLKKVITDANAALDQAEDLMTQLEMDPAGVEKLLRELKVELKAADGTEDYSPGKMGSFLKTIQANANRVLRREVPQRAEMLKQADAYAQEALTILPELKDPKSARKLAFNSVLENAPWLKQQPHWPRTAAIYALGLEAYQKLQGAKGKPAATAVKPKRAIPTVIPSPRGQPAVTATRAAGRSQISDETATKALNGDRKSRLAFIQTLVPR